MSEGSEPGRPRRLFRGELCRRWLPRLNCRIIAGQEAKAPVTDAHRSGDRCGSEPARLASFGRRLAAFILDMLLLTVFGEVVRAAFSDPLSHSGDYRGLIAWAGTTAYFGYFEGRWGRGRSVGKRLLDLCVIRPDNTYLSPVEAGLRAALVTAPLMLNGSEYETAVLGRVARRRDIRTTSVDSLSRRDQQQEATVLLHDLAFDTLVVRQEDRDLQRPLPLPAALWRGHFVVVSLILFAFFLAFVAMSIVAVLTE